MMMINRLDYENSVIGSILIDGERMGEALDILNPDDFYRDQHKRVFEAAAELWMDGNVVDPVAIFEKMKVNGTADESTEAFLIELMHMTPTAVNLTLYANGVRQASRLSQTKQILRDMVDNHRDPDILIANIVDGLSALERSGGKKTEKRMVDLADAFVAWAKGENEVAPILSGNSRLDKVWGGMLPGQLIVVAARPGVGKSAFAAQLAQDAARRGNMSALFSAEMEELEIMQRFVAAESGVSMNVITSRGFARGAGDDGKIAAKAVLALKELPILVDDNPQISTIDIRRTLQKYLDIKLVIIDYVQLMMPTMRGENRNLEIGEITRTLKMLAKEFSVPIVLLSQLNRKKDELDEPSLIDLRDSGSIEQDADTVLLLWKLEYTRDGEMTKVAVKVAKNRQGKKGTVVTYFDGECMTFRETAEEYVPRTSGRGRRFGKKCDDDFPDKWIDK